MLSILLGAEHRGMNYKTYISYPVEHVAFWISNYKFAES